MDNKTINTVYKIFDNNDNLQGAYSRSYHTEYKFDSLDEARNSNCHGEYKDKAKYKIKKYKVTYELIDDNVDPPTDNETLIYNKKADIDKKLNKKLNKEADKLGLSGLGRWNFITGRAIYESLMKVVNQREGKG